MQNSFVREAIDLLKGEASVGHLELGLWSLESLYKLRNTLANSIDCIEAAKTELMTQVKQVKSRCLRNHVCTNPKFLIKGARKEKRSTRKIMPRSLRSL